MSDLKESGRKSNFELLRILAMSLIILIHLAPSVSLSDLGLSGNIGHVMGAIIVGIGNIGPACFCLISGYFGIRFSWKKLLKLEIMMITYSLLETFILIQIFPSEMQGAALLEQVAKSFLPFISRKYWFYSCYICVFLFSGYIQKFIDTLKKEEFERVIGLFLLIFSIFPTIFYFEIMQDAGKGLIQMTLLYMIGRYIRLYHNEPSSKSQKIVCFFALWSLNAISMLHPIRVGAITHSFCRDNSITNIAMAILLLYIFKDINFSSKHINKFTGNMFAVFALENTLVSVAAKFINESALNINYLFPGLCLLVGIVLLIFTVCIGMGSILELLFGRIENCIIEGLLRLIHSGNQFLFKIIQNQKKDNNGKS